MEPVCFVASRNISAPLLIAHGAPDSRSAFPKHTHKSYLPLLPAVFAMVEQYKVFIVSAAVCTICSILPLAYS